MEKKLTDSIIKEINEIFGAKIRLGVMTILSMNDESDFSSLKKQLEVSDGNLGAHMNVLEKSGYIKVDKSFVNRRPKTSYKITEKGRKAFLEHLTQLESIIKKVK